MKHDVTRCHAVALGQSVALFDLCAKLGRGTGGCADDGMMADLDAPVWRLGFCQESRQES